MMQATTIMRSLLLLVILVSMCTVHSAPYVQRDNQRSKRTHFQRGKTSADDSNGLHVRVNPHKVMADEYGVVTVVCTATAGRRIEDLPFISFSWEVEEDAGVPLSSSFPGVHIESLDEGLDEDGRQLYAQRLTIESPMYDILQRGHNRFVCKANNMAGLRARDEFIIQKFS